MGTTHETTTELKEMLALLRKTPLGSLPIEHVRPVEEAAYRLARQEPCWVPEEDTYPLMGATVPGSICSEAEPSRTDRSQSGSTTSSTGAWNAKG